MNETTRKGIPHLWAPGNSMEMKDSYFEELIKDLKVSDYILSPTTCKITEKVDGAGIRFGMHNERFFFESSRSGLIFDRGAFSKYTVAKKGVADKMSIGYDIMFDILKNNEKLQEHLSYIMIGDFKFIGEVLYNDFGQYSEDKSKIKFVNTWYDTNLIGKTATFILFDLVNEFGESYPYAQSLIDMIIRYCSNSDVMISTPKLECSFCLDVSKDYTREGIHKKILQSFDRSKFGNEYEGFVIKTHNTTFKVVSESFVNAKRRPK